MGLKRAFIFGFLAALILIAGCAGFSYRYYGLSEVVYDHGNLLGPKPKDDLPFSKCAPNAQTKNPCVVMFTKDFYNLRLDYDDTKNRLIDCEKKAK
jgi:hypothetical protein